MRNRFTPNEMLVIDNVCKIICYNTNHEETGHCLIDVNDMELCKQYKWHISHYGYIIGANKGVQVKMHRFLLGAQKGELVDHINNDKKDNRRSNLRLVDYSGNNQNVKKYRNNTTGFKGVYRIKGSKHKYMAQIMHNYVSIYLGMFETAELAAAAYNKKALELFGDFAELNIMGDTNENN